MFGPKTAEVIWQGQKMFHKDIHNFISILPVNQGKCKLNTPKLFVIINICALIYVVTFV